MLGRIFWILSICVLFSFQVVTANSTQTHNKLGDSINMSLPEKNLKLGHEFLAENKHKHGVHTLPSGLQYKITHEGQGTPPGPTDFVTVNYRGMLTNGTEFDSSYTHNMPATFAVNAVIPGWTEILQLMKPGSKWTVYIPPNLAYGEYGAGRLIGPNATLVFDIELLSVKPALDEIPNGFNEEIDED
jgi:FKBP-type peptidyl-prolyl cis-trans isomerase FklB